MDAKELKERYKSLFMKMKESEISDYHHIFSMASKKMFMRIADVNIDMAEEWISELEAMCWNNYLSEVEADYIANRLVNQDEKKGPKWTKDVFFSKVHELGGVIEDKPYYNKFALWATACMIFSDHAHSICEDLGFSFNQMDNSSNYMNKIALSCYKKAVEKLKDEDRKRFVRSYFGLDCNC